MSSAPAPRRRFLGPWFALAAGGLALAAILWPGTGLARPPRACHHPHHGEGHTPDWDVGEWFWQRSPDQEKRVITHLYNRYCVRCHGIDGRGVWDMPDVPNFANARWQASRSDGQLARIILEGRGAVMPAFRGTLTLEQAWAMARYLRSFVPGTETSRTPASEK